MLCCSLCIWNKDGGCVGWKLRLYLISRTIKDYKEDRQKAYNDITTYTYPIKIKDVVWL